MLQERCLIVALLICIVQPPFCLAQSSQELNNQGCDAVARHDYAKAEELFVAAAKEAAKAHDLKRVHTALDNLKDLYASRGLDSDARRIDRLIYRIDHPFVQQSRSNSSAQDERVLGSAAHDDLQDLMDQRAAERARDLRDVIRRGQLMDDINRSTQSAPPTGTPPEPVHYWHSTSMYGQTINGVHYGPGTVWGVQRHTDAGWVDAGQYP